MISVSINNSNLGILKVKDSDGYVIYANEQFRHIDYLFDLDLDLYLIHLRIENKNYYEILQLQEINSTLEIKIGSRIF